MPWLAMVPVLNGCAPHVQLAVAPDIQSATWSAQSSIDSGNVGVTEMPLDWAAFGSPRLDALLDQVRAANTDIAIANARIAQAAADLRIARAANVPTLEAFGRAESNARGGSGDNAFRDSYIAGDLDLTYTLDLSGRLKASKKAAHARYRAAGYEADAMRLNVEAAAATAYVEYAALCDRIAIAEQALANAREFERTLMLRVDEGIASQVDAGIQANEANEIALNLSRLREARSRTRQAIAVLAGVEAPLFELEPASLTDFRVPQFRPYQPASLVTRRPDMLAAAARIDAAKGDVERARAAFVPDIELSAGSFVDSAVGGGILNPGFALAARMVATIFDNGRLKGQVYRASAEQQEAVELYRKTLLNALAEAQNAIGAVQASGERLTLLANSRDHATRTATLARNRFVEGADDFGTVLDAERQRLTVADALASSQQQALNSAIALYVALGGDPR
jgi:multidrug efflux system outer membrane protein